MSTVPAGCRGIRRLPAELVDLYWSSGVVNDVPALAWFLLSALVPLALGVTALAAFALGDYAHASALAARMASVLPHDVHDQVVALVLRTRDQSPLLIAGSVASMIWVCSGVVGVLERCMARLLTLPGAGVVMGKLRNLALAAAVVLMIVLMVVVASAGTGLAERLSLNHTLIRIGLPLMSLSVTILLCGAVYLRLGGHGLRRRAALAGGLVSAVILQATPTAAGYYLRYFAGNTPVGLFLMLTGILFTCYVAALGLLLGAAVTARVQLGQGPL
jgi:uncharacterized BrkB/YihY/UPF0761 family membrane protein